MLSKGVKELAERYPERVVYYRGEYMNELRALRLSYGFKSSDVARELGFKGGSVYSLHENNRRMYTYERYEQFYYDVGHALYRLAERRREQGIAVLTDDLYEKIKLKVESGVGIIMASIEHDSDYIEVINRAVKLGDYNKMVL